MDVRRLRASETEALLQLLDGWRLSDGWRGASFFRRYLEQDPSFAAENVWVAEAAGGLASCVQIFPRTLRLRGTDVPLCGIGTVFTRADRRRRGAAARVLAAAVDDAGRRGFEMGMLFAARLEWYRGLGWHSLRVDRCRIRPGPAPPPVARSPTEPAVRDFEAGDLDAVAALHRRVTDDLDGPLRRGRREWRTSLRVAGNPGEAFVVAEKGGELAAYARATVLYDRPTVTEWCCAPGEEAALVATVRRLLRRDLWPLRPAPPAATAGRTDLLAPPAPPPLRSALRAAGLELVDEPDSGAMVRTLSPGALAARLGVGRDRTEGDPSRRFRPAKLAIWPADRF